MWDTGKTLRGPDTDQWLEGYRHDTVHFNTLGFTVFSDSYRDFVVTDFNLTANPSPTSAPFRSPTPTPTRPSGCQLLSQGKTVTVDSTFSGSYPGSRVTDGVITTDNGRWVSASATTHWCKIDLGQAYDLCQVLVYGDEAFSGDPVWNLTAYTVRGSLNGIGDVSTWPILADFFDYCGSPYPNYPGSGANACNTHTVTGKYRYVALHITGSDATCGAIARVAEVQVLGSLGLPTPTPTATLTPTPLVAGAVEVR